MAKVLIFKYDCGWERTVHPLPGQTLTEVRQRFWPRFRKLHKRTCRTCFGRLAVPLPNIPDTPTPNW